MDANPKTSAAQTPRPTPMAASDRPRACADLEIHATSDGLLVYQVTRERVHHLNPSAAAVLQLCGGDTTVAEVPLLLAELFNLPVAPVDDVLRCLASLRDEGLIEVDPTRHKLRPVDR